MSIWDEPLTKEEYSRRLFELKADRRRQDALLPFEEKVEIVLALQDGSRALRGTLAIESRSSSRHHSAGNVDRGFV